LEDEGTPPLSSNASDGNDRSSDYDPTFETPSKPGKTTGRSLYTFDDDDDDMKPELSDDEISYPGIIGDDHREESEDEESYGKKSKGKGKANAKATPKKVSPRKPNGSVGGSGKKPGVGWTPEEDWTMFQKMHPKTSKPNWQDVADCVGRDPKVSPVKSAILMSSLVRTDTQSFPRSWRAWSRGCPGSRRARAGGVGGDADVEETWSHTHIHIQKATQYYYT
jgi:hypothetical protein